jgi:hypothetical protein
MRFDALAVEGEFECDENLLPQSKKLKLEDGEPIEIKSINNKNSFDIQSYIDGFPRDNYVMQLAIYMDALNKETGHLFAATIDGLNGFWFECKKIGEGKYQAGNTIVDIFAEYKRFAEIYKKFEAGEDPNWFEETYKFDVNTLDWTKVSKTKIGNARNNKGVVGSEDSWKLMYSPYTDILLEKQGVKRGYTEEELVVIAEKTKGYTTWDKKE